MDVSRLKALGWSATNGSDGRHRSTYEWYRKEPPLTVNRMVSPA